MAFGLKKFRVQEKGQGVIHEAIRSSGAPGAAQTSTAREDRLKERASV